MSENEYTEAYRFSMRSSGPDFREINVAFQVDTLDRIVEHMKQFLNSVGFTYVDALIATSKNKAWVASNDETYETEVEEEETLEV